MKGQDWMMEFDESFLSNIVDSIYNTFSKEIGTAIQNDKMMRAEGVEIKTIGVCDVVVGVDRGYEGLHNVVIVCGPRGFTPGDAVYFRVRTDPKQRMPQFNGEVLATV